MSKRALICGALMCMTLWAGDCIRVDGDRILARHLVAAVAGLEAVPAETFIGFSPKPGVARWLPPALIEAIAARTGVKLRAPAAVCVERQATKLEAAAIRKAMEASLTKAGYSKFELQVLAYPQHPLPAGELEFPVSGLGAAAGAPGESLWRGRLKLAESQSIPVRVRVSVSVEAEELRAARTIRVGEVLSADDLKMVVLRATPGTETKTMKPAEAAGMQARRRIEAGRAVLPGMLASPPEIRKGDAVLVMVAAGSASLGVRARAETMARTGETVVLTNLSSGKKFRARATGRGQAVVDLEPTNDKASSSDGAAQPAGADAGAVQAGRQEAAGGVGTGPDHR